MPALTEKSSALPTQVLTEGPLADHRMVMPSVPGLSLQNASNDRHAAFLGRSRGL